MFTYSNVVHEFEKDFTRAFPTIVDQQQTLSDVLHVICRSATVTCIIESCELSLCLADRTLYQKKKKKKESKPIKLIGDRICVNIARIFAAIALSCSRYEGYDIALYYEASPEYLQISFNTKFENRNTNSSRKEKTLTDILVSIHF